MKSDTLTLTNNNKKIRIHQQQQNGKLKSLSPNQQKKFLSFQSGIQRRKYKFAANFYFSFVFFIFKQSNQRSKCFVMMDFHTQ